ncbi:MAG: PEF-CTERM sorting domain-containing protein [Candidatus Methanoperedens sp.]|nr:PEF-CTERM sorting domain-containing protein [Candidatus Methanoperedens sp.]
MRNKIIRIMVMFVVMATMTGNALAGGVEAHLWLNDINSFPDNPGGYTTSSSDFDIYIANQDNTGAADIKLIISIPGSTQGTLPSHIITITKNGIPTSISGSDWIWGTPSATKVGGQAYNMPPSGTFPSYYAYYDMGPIGAKDSLNALITAHVNINGAPPVRFDAWGFNSDNRIILNDPFSHNLTYVPEFATVAIPIAAVLGLVFFFQHRKKKEE